jgi:tRNA-Thr(GGU) m(6)t(6)A37 methyltransferase TsaA
LVEELEGEIVFEPSFRNPDFLRGLDEFDYIWLLWEFSANKHATKNAMVRPPILGGNERVGVFATRSPFRPNNIGLSSVRLIKIEWESNQGPIIKVKGADLMDGTPIFDIKPYVKYADCHEDARSGFVDNHSWKRLQVIIPEEIQQHFSLDELKVLKKVLSIDPRPQIQTSKDKIYGMPYGCFDIRFRVENETLTVIDLKNLF